MKQYFIRYGCYLGKDSEVIEADSLEEAEQSAYEAGYQATDGWYGMHGFELDEEDTAEMSEEELAEAIHLMVDEATESWAAEYDPEKHDKYF